MKDKTYLGQTPKLECVKALRLVEVVFWRPQRLQAGLLTLVNVANAEAQDATGANGQSARSPERRRVPISCGARLFLSRRKISQRG